MEANRLRASTLPTAFSNALADIADLFQKELRLVRAELSFKLARKFRGGVWILAAALLLVVAAAVFAQALVLWIASFGISLHLACLMVAALFALLAVFAYAAGKSDVSEDLTPTQSIHQFQEDIRTTKEQLK